MCFGGDLDDEGVGGEVVRYLGEERGGVCGEADGVRLGGVGEGAAAHVGEDGGGVDVGLGDVERGFQTAD